MITEGCGGPAKAADHTTNTTPAPKQTGCCNSIAYQLHRRRDASLRLVPLDCGCRDSWTCRCTQPPLSDRFVDAGRDAAQHLLNLGKVPLLEIEVLRALYRRGGDDRWFAERLHQMVGGVVG